MSDAPNTSSDDSLSGLVDELASAVVMADAKDKAAVAAVSALLRRVAEHPAAESVRAEAAEALAALTGRSVPKRTKAIADVASLVATLQAAASDTPTLGASSPAAAEANAASDGPRDPETLDLISDFLQEAGEGLDSVEGLLMALENDGLDTEKIHALFRVFHTIKGVSAFLDMHDVTRLAHTTETLLDLVRTGELSLESTHIDVVFEAATCMRAMLDGVRRVLEKGGAGAFPTEAGLPALVARLEAAAVRDGAPKPAADAEAAADEPEAEAEAEAEADDDEEDAPAPLAAAPQAAIVKAKPEAAAPVAEAAAPDGGGAARPKVRETLKVDLERIDSVVEMIGELIIVESMVVNAPEIAQMTSLKVRNYLGQLTKISRDLQNVAMRMRMVPVRGVFQKMQRMVRDLAKKTGKDVIFVQSGEAAEMDRSMVERIEDPLVHMIRNSVDHGLETAEARRAAGKPEVGTVRLSAYHEGGSIVIEISDDGKGLDRDAIMRKAVSQGLAREGDQLSDAEVHGLIFQPGFSTAAKLTEISGRGVGMDVVKRSIEAMRGRIVTASTPGKGSTFKLVLPLTLAIIDGMLVSCGSERYIIPSLSVIESLQPTEGMVRAFADQKELIHVRGEFMPLVRLHRLFNVEGEELPITQARIVVVETIGRKLGLLVDDVVTQQQVVIKPLTGVGDRDLLAGAAILADGRVGLILNTDRLSGLFAGSSAEAWTNHREAA